MLDTSFGQIVSFASFDQTSFSCGGPLWHKLEEGRAALSLAEQAVPHYGLARESPTDKRPSSMRSSNGINRPEAWTGGAEEQRRKRQRKKAMFLPLGKDASPLK